MDAAREFIRSGCDVGGESGEFIFKGEDSRERVKAERYRYVSWG